MIQLQVRPFAHTCISFMFSPLPPMIRQNCMYVVSKLYGFALAAGWFMVYAH